MPATTNAPWDAGDTKALSTVERSFEIIETLYRMDGSGVTELAEVLDFPKSTVHVHLKTLQNCGYVVRDGDGYRVSYRFLEIGGGQRARGNLYDIASGEIDKLSDESGELALLAIEEAGRAVILRKSGNHDSIDDNTPVGGRLPLHSTALGKAILAHRPSGEIDAIIARHGLTEEGPKSITSRKELMDDLREIREREYAISDEEYSKGVRGVASPIVIDGESVSAIAISGPAKRLTMDRINDKLAEIILELRNIIEIRMRYY